MPQPAPGSPKRPADALGPAKGVPATPKPPRDGLYADGGVAKCNPSPWGGTWAYIFVQDGRAIKRGSGILLPKHFGTPTISNNASELIAALRGLQALPEGWSGFLYTDSQVTIHRLRKRPPRNGLLVLPENVLGVPEAIMKEVRAAQKRLGFVRYVLLGGHPTSMELRRGYRERNGLPVSPWNVACDEICSELAKRFRIH